MRQALVNNHINRYTNIINFIKENTEQYDILIEDLPSSEDHVNFPNKVTFEPNRNYLDVGAREKQNTKNRRNSMCQGPKAGGTLCFVGAEKRSLFFEFRAQDGVMRGEREKERERERLRGRENTTAF